MPAGQALRAQKFTPKVVAQAIHILRLTSRTQSEQEGSEIVVCVFSLVLEVQLHETGIAACISGLEHCGIDTAS